MNWGPGQTEVNSELLAGGSELMAGVERTHGSLAGDELLASLDKIN
jgi:hypothetical protein